MAKLLPGVFSGLGHCRAGCNFRHIKVRPRHQIRVAPWRHERYFVDPESFLW